jgi:outer membrane protein OmpA-like peptidoglycan-associated protein/tetratricopeptide (TPR) repeat protein
MKIRFIISYLLLFVLPCITALNAQVNVAFDEDNFPEEQKKQLKEAIREIKDGDDYFYNDILQYALAIEFYLKANNFNPNNALLNYKIGLCYLKTVQKTQSILFFEKAIKLDPKVKPDLSYLLGQAYQLGLEPDKAIKKYEEYRQTLTPFELSESKGQIDKKISECEVEKEMIRNPVRVFIDNLGSTVNSKFHDYSPYVNGDETVLMFTSSRDNTTGGGIDPFDLMYYEDIYISYKDKDADDWGSPVNPGKPLNTDSHDAIVGISPDGKHALIYKGGENAGDIYDCHIKEGAWQYPKSLPKEINTEYHETSASFSPDMQAIYFVSDKPGGYGGKDIYISHLERKGNSDKLAYSEAENLGATINTPYDEEGVFMSSDGKSLYFSSKGHKTMGGYDIFKSEITDGKLTEPVNIGYPVNTPDDDVFFSIAKDGRHGYYSSFDPEGSGQRDLFMITFLGHEKPLVTKSEFDLLAFKLEPANETFFSGKKEIKSLQIVIIKGIISEQVTLTPLGSVPVEIYDNQLGQMVASFESSSPTGAYTVSLPSGRNYGFAVKAKEYLFYSENLTVPPSTTIREITMDIYLKKIEVGSKIVLKNIFFDFNKSTLRPESKGELDRLITLLNEVPSLKIEISGHTDNVGSALYNQQLSESRAKSVVEYLISQGIDQNRLIYKGYAMTQPVATNDTEEGRQMNRRTEFKVLSK